MAIDTTSAQTMADQDKRIAQMLADIATLKAENERLAQAKVQAAAKLSFKVSDKGGVSVYGLGRFPVTLYGQQWARLFEALPALQMFLKANVAKLSVK